MEKVTTSPELEQCIKDREALEETRKKTQDAFSNDMQDASVVQGDSSNQQSEIKNTLEEFIKTKTEWSQLKAKISTLTAEYNGLVSEAGPLRVRYKGCMDAINLAAKAKAKAQPAKK